MDGLWSGILATYADFFNGAMWIDVLSNPESWGLIGTLILLEGLLSADNALVLAVMVRHLEPLDRKKALFYGLIGAYFFRFLAIGLGVYLIKLWWIKVLGAAYLAWLSLQYFLEKKRESNADVSCDENKESQKNGLFIKIFGSFWGTVVSVELMDLSFSVDSILAAFGVSQQVWVLFVGGVFGVLMMRGVAGVFLKVIDKIPELETAAYILIMIISIKMFLGVFSIHIPNSQFFVLILLTFGVTILSHFIKSGRLTKKPK